MLQTIQRKNDECHNHHEPFPPSNLMLYTTGTTSSSRTPFSMNGKYVYVYKYLGRDYSLFTGHNPRICLLFELCIIPPGIRHIV